MSSITTGSTTIPFGATLRIGYRVNGSTVPYTYLGYFPGYNELPYTFTLSAGVWQIEYTTICPNCSGSIYSEPQTTVVVAT